MATTTNFGWTTPDDTDLVKDGAAAIRTSLNGVDTSFVDLKGGTTGQVLAKASATDLDFVWSADAAGMTNPMTTTGDVIYSSPGSTPVRLGIGSTDDVLTVAAGVPTWAPPAPGGGMTLLSTTTLTGASVTLSSISGSYKNLYFVIENAKMVNNGVPILMRFNADSTASRHAYSDSWVSVRTFNQTSAWLTAGNDGNITATGLLTGTIFDYTNTSTWKYGLTFGIATDTGTGADPRFFQNTMAYNQIGAITSLQFLPYTGNWTSGTLLLYGVN